MPFFRLLSEFRLFLTFPTFFFLCVCVCVCVCVCMYCMCNDHACQLVAFLGSSDWEKALAWTPTGGLPLDPAGDSDPRPPITRYFPTFLNSPSGIPECSWCHFVGKWMFYHSVSSTMFMKLTIKVVAFFLGHPVYSVSMDSTYAELTVHNRLTV